MKENLGFLVNFNTGQYSPQVYHAVSMQSVTVCSLTDVNGIQVEKIKEIYKL